MKCKNCSAENTPGNLFCDNCGHEFEKCPVCQKVHELKKFCPIYGFDIMEYIKKSERIKNTSAAFDNFEQPLEHKRLKIHLIISTIIFVSVSFVVFLFGGNGKFDTAQKLALSTSLPLAYWLCSYLLLYDRNRQRYKKEFKKQFPDDAKYLD